MNIRKNVHVMHLTYKEKAEIKLQVKLAQGYMKELLKHLDNGSSKVIDISTCSDSAINHLNKISTNELTY
jgi:hypothetical protein